MLKINPKSGNRSKEISQQLGDLPKFISMPVHVQHMSKTL